MPDTYIQLPDSTYVQIPEGTSPDKLAAFKTKLAQRFPAKAKASTPSSTQPTMRAAGPAEDYAAKEVAKFREGYFKGDLSKNIPGQLVQRLVKNPNDKAALEQVARFRSPIAQQAVHEEVSERRGRTVGGSMPLSYQAQQISKEGGIKAGVGGNILPLFESMIMDPVNLMLMGAGAAPEEAAAKAIGGGVGKVVGKLRGASAGRAAELTAARVVPKAVRATMGGAIAAQVAPKIAEGIKEKDYPKAIGSAIIGGIALGAGLRGIREPEVPSGVVQKPTAALSEADVDAALKRTVPGKETKGATVQAKQEQGAATPDVRAGEGREAGKGRGQGKGQGQQREAAAGTRQAQEKVRAAAIRHPQTGEVKEGPDHPTILKQEGIEGFNTRKSRETPEFGFVTSEGRFVTREEAANIARASGQQKAPFTITKEGKTIAHADQIDMTPPFHEGLRTAYDAVLKENPQLDRDTVPIGTVYRMAKRMKLIPSDMTIDQFVAEGHKANMLPGAEGGMAPASTGSRSSKLKKYTVEQPGEYPQTYSYVRYPEKGAAAPPAEPKPAAPPTTPPTEKVAAGTAPEGDKPIGIAERVRRRMAEQGRAAPYEAGEGATPQEMRAIGREMAKEIPDPEAYLSDMEKAGTRLSGDDIAYLRHIDEQNVKAADQAKIAADRNPLDPKLQKAAQDAAAARDAWYKRISKYRTESHRAFVAQQGSEDADTGEFSLTHFTEHFEDVNKRPMTPEEKQHAEKVNLKTAELSDSIKKDEAALDAELKKSAPKQRKDDLPSDPEQLKATIQKMKEDGTFRVNPRQTRQTGAFRVNRGAINPKVARAVWNHAKAHYIDIQATLGMPVNFDDMVNGTATDLGMPPDEVREAFASNKNVQNITLGMYRKRAERAYAISQARQWLADRNAPGYSRWYRAITNIPRGFKVFGHGTVGMITHAGPTLFSSLSPGITIKGKTYLKGSTWDEYWPNFFRQFKWFAGPGATARHNAAMADLIRHPRFGEWKSAGLAIDPRTVYDNYQAYGKHIGAIGRLGNNGMDALKTFRLDYAEKVYAGLSASAKADPDAMALIARSINHITGATESRLGRASGLLFAPSLEIARWQRYGDVIRSVGTVANWKNASPAEKFMAGWQAKRAMEMTAVYMGTLVANDQLNRKLNSGHYVNFNDPTKSDFLKPKWGDRVYDPTGGAINPARLTATIAGYSTGKIDPPTFRGRQLRKREAITDRATQYLQGKLNPAIQAGLEGASQEDFLGRPLPFSKEPGTPYRPKYEWGEYLWTQAPIPFAGAADIFYDEMRKQGVDHATSQVIWDGMVAWGTEMLGVRTSPEPGTYMPAKKGSVLGGKLPK